MAKDNKYGYVEIPKLGANEPVFILRAQDALALPAILKYMQDVASLGRVDDPMIPMLRKTIANFAEYQGAKKLPD